jgi:TldD protein
MGQRVAAPISAPSSTTATIGDRRGSLTIDDEGTPTQSTVLIEDGILRGYMQDRQSTRVLMGMNADRQRAARKSSSHHPMPRMTNTMHDGRQRMTPAEILKSREEGPLRRQFRRRAGRHHERANSCSTPPRPI